MSSPSRSLTRSTSSPPQQPNTSLSTLLCPGHASGLPACLDHLSKPTRDGEEIRDCWVGLALRHCAIQPEHDETSHRFCEYLLPHANLLINVLKRIYVSAIYKSIIAYIYSHVNFWNQPRYCNQVLWSPKTRTILGVPIHKSTCQQCLKIQ